MRRVPIIVFAVFLVVGLGVAGAAVGRGGGGLLTASRWVSDLDDDTEPVLNLGAEDVDVTEELEAVDLMDRLLNGLAGDGLPDLEPADIADELVIDVLVALDHHLGNRDRLRAGTRGQRQKQ